MAALSGRKVIIRDVTDPLNPVVVAAARSKSITINNEPIDITSDDDAGVRKLLEGVGEQAERSVDVSVEGVTKNGKFIAALLSGANVTPYEIEITGIGTLAGSFFLTSTALTAPYNEASTFTAELQSTGDVTYTAAA
jgi:TP901-1 family phage major tail protein